MRVVVDLDGTIADLSHRLHFIEGESKDWDSFHEACDQDTPILVNVDVVKALAEAGNEVMYWTGRSDIGDVRAKTIAWLCKHGMPLATAQGLDSPSDYLRMRAPRDHRADHILKGEWLAETRGTGREIHLVFEDRSRVVGMYRANGVTCFQVAVGDF